MAVGIASESPVSLSQGRCRELLVGSDVAFDDRGIDVLKGVTGNWHVYGRRRDRRTGLSHQRASLFRAGRRPSGPLASRTLVYYANESADAVRETEPRERTQTRTNSSPKP